MKTAYIMHRLFGLKRIVLILFLFLIVFLGCACGKANSSSLMANEDDYKTENLVCDQGKVYSCPKPLDLYPIDCNDVIIYNHSEIITKRLEIQSLKCETIRLNVSVPDGIIILSDLQEDIAGLNHVDISFKVNDSFIDGKIEFYAQSEYGICYTDLYLLHEGNYDYTSFLSMEAFIPYSERIRQYYEDEWKKGESSYIISEQNDGENSQTLC